MMQEKNYCEQDEAEKEPLMAKDHITLLDQEVKKTNFQYGDEEYEVTRNLEKDCTGKQGDNTDLKIRQEFSRGLSMVKVR